MSKIGNTFKDLIIYEGRDFIGVNKPPFLSSLNDRVSPNNLLQMAREYLPELQACHRLDKDTSGALIFAKNPEAYRHLSIQFEKRLVDKTYHAVVDGIHDFKNHLVDAPIAKLDDGKVKINKREGRPAQTYFTTLKTHNLYTLVECRPITGRMHQIRIHLSVVNASISGDLQYGGKEIFLSALKRGYNLKKFTEEQPLLKRMALHAKSVEFKGLDGVLVKVEAPYPKDFRALIRQLHMD